MNVLLALMEFHAASIDVREAWVPSSSTTPLSMFYREASCQCYLPRAEQCLSPNPLFFLHKWMDREIARRTTTVNTVIAIARFLLRQFADDFVGAR